MPALLWTLLWLSGTAAITGFSVTRHAPALERAMLDEVQRAVAPFGDTPVTVSVEDHVVTLAGTVPDPERRDRLLDAAAAAPGIRHVTDRLVVREPLPADVGVAVAAPLPGGTDEGGTSTDDGPEATLLVADVAARPDEPSTEAGRAESDPPPAPDDAPPDAVAADGSSEAEPTPPSLRFDVADGVLTIDGELSPSDDPAVLIEPAMDSFELDFVSNAVETSESVAEAGWLEPLVSLLPVLARLEAPGVEVSERRVTLRGEAADLVTRDEVVEAALERLGDYAVIERIVVRDRSGASPDGAADLAERPDEDIPEAPGAVADAGGGVAAETDAGAEPTGEAAAEAAVNAAAEAAVRAALEANAEARAAAEGDLADEAAGTTSVAQAGDDATITSPDDDAPTTPGTSGTDVSDAGPAADETFDAADPDDDPDDDPNDDPGDDPSDELEGRPAVVPGQASDGSDAPPSADGRAPGSAALRAEIGALPSTRILFRPGSDRLTAESRDVLDAMADVLRRHPGVPVTIGGHTDAVGGTRINLQLSQLRANAVREHLVTRGVERERISARGYGESLPIADNATAEGRAINRRIEFTY